MREQDFRDPYLDLVNPEHNRVKRYWKTCRKCEFVYRTPTLTTEEEIVLYDRYRDISFRKESPDEFFNRIISLPPEKSENFIKLSWLLNELKRHSLVIGKKKPISVLDVGCGGGVLLHTFRAIYPNIQPVGVESTAEFAELAKRRLNAEIIPTYYQKGLFKHKFDIILCTHVLEHVYDLRSFVSVIVQDLDEKGAVFIEVPDVSDFKILAPDYQRFFAPHHYYFSLDSLRRLLSEQGLKIISSNCELSVRGECNLGIIAVKDR